MHTRRPGSLCSCPQISNINKTLFSQLSDWHISRSSRLKPAVFTLHKSHHGDTLRCLCVQTAVLRLRPTSFQCERDILCFCHVGLSHKGLVLNQTCLGRPSTSDIISDSHTCCLETVRLQRTPSSLPPHSRRGVSPRRNGPGLLFLVVS